MMPPQPPPISPPTWRYAVRSADFPALSLQKVLDDAGREGWELVSVIAARSPSDPANSWFVVLKQPGA